MQQERIRPAYEVHPFTGTAHRRVAKMTEKGLVTETVKESGGYMVYFPRGHSIRVRTDDELRRLGFADPAALIDMETGEAHGTALQRASLIASAQSKSGRAALMKQSLARDTDAGEKEGVE